jgi:hypothetical protein
VSVIDEAQLLAILAETSDATNAAALESDASEIQKTLF